MTKLLSHEQDNIDLNIVMVRVKKGAEIPAYAHEQHDIAYHIAGKGKMWIVGAGDFDVRPGTLYTSWTIRAITVSLHSGSWVATAYIFMMRATTTLSLS